MSDTAAALLPSEDFADLRAQAAVDRAASGLREAHALNPQEQARLRARLELCQAFQTWQRRAGLTVVAAQYQFAADYSAGQLPASADTRALYPTLTRGTLARWLSELRREGVARLAGRYGNRRGQSAIAGQPELSDYIKGVLVTYPHISHRLLWEGLRARFAARADITLPGARSLERWVNQWKQDNAQVFLAVTNPDRWKNECMAAHGSKSEAVTQLNQLWEFDATPADLLLEDGRYCLSGVIDVYSRRLKLLVTRTAKAAAIAALLRRALLEWGVPAQAQTDNGSDYVSHHVTRVFSALQIEQVLCPPFQPWHKPHIERVFRSFAHHLAELLPGFVGHNVAEREALRARESFADRLFQKNATVELRINAQTLQDFCDRWCASLYEHRAHAGLNGATPFERVAGWTGPVRRIHDERALDLLLAEAPDNHGRRTVHKKGIRLKWPQEPAHHWYIAPELALHVGVEVFTAFDPAGDMGRLYVFGAEGFLCIAECPELTGIDRQAYALAAKQRLTASVQAQRRALQAVAKAVDAHSLAAEILAQGEARVSNVTLFRRPGEAHQPEALTEAAAAIAAADASDAPREPVPISAAAVARVAAIMAQAPVEDRPEIRFSKAVALLDGQLAGSAEELEWLAMYQTSSEFRGQYLAWRSLGRGLGRNDLEGDPWLDRRVG